MIEFAALGAGAIKDLLGLLKGAIEDPDTYKRLDGLRQLLCEITGREIDKNGFVALLEGVTQGECYTGQWEPLNDDEHDSSRRLRVQGGWIFDIGRGNGILVQDRD